MKKRIKVLFFLFGGAGGAERMTVNIGKMLPEDKFEAIFVLCGKLREISEFIPSEYMVEEIPWNNIHCFPRIRISRILHKHKPDYAFCSIMNLNLLLLQAASFRRVKCIVRNDNMLERTTKSRRMKINIWYRRAYKIVAQQEEMYSELAGLGISPQKLYMLHNVIDTGTIEKKLSHAGMPYPENDNVKYLCINSFSRIKAQDITMEAFIRVHKQNPHSELYFLGIVPDGSPVFRRVMNLIDENGLTDYVHIIGYDSNPYKWIRYADCLVSTSRLEGLPNALIEAQYLGVPAVATECIPMIRRIISNGETGYTVPVDNVDAIAEAMLSAPSLGRIKMTYVPASHEDFINLFS